MLEEPMKPLEILPCVLRGALFGGIAWAGYPVLALALLASFTWMIDRSIEEVKGDIRKIQEAPEGSIKASSFRLKGVN